MIAERLEPKSELLGKEYVLVQAWKKATSYIRSHNWYADTLELDRSSADLPNFLQDLANRLIDPTSWENDRLRIVPAPKSQKWGMESGRWGPIKNSDISRKLRPLAHVSLRDQVAATALMLCLADRVETKQGDPNLAIDNRENRTRVISYGNRLFCDAINGSLFHRWGSTKLYRGYFQDYRLFVSRPEVVAQEIGPGKKAIIVYSDLKQFYDRVRPTTLYNRIKALSLPSDDPRFYEIAQRVLSWRWDKRDEYDMEDYAKKTGVKDFSKVALPQGLVSAGFYANIVLLDFDQSLREEIDKEIVEGVILKDACRYVDDIRLVLSGSNQLEIKEIEKSIVDWLGKLLEKNADGLIPSADKTQAAVYRGEERPLVRQSRKMERIQHAISAGFDAVGGEEILDAVQGLIVTQSHYSKDRIEAQGWELKPIPDVKDETVARFAAARFRSTFRSLRPLLENCTKKTDNWNQDKRNINACLRVSRTQHDLDDEAKSFALGLIEKWVEDPSNVRLLRIGMDLWPDANVLKKILENLCQYTTKGGRRKAPRRVAWYCLAEIFRAAVTETGLVDDNERLPEGADVNGYRAVLLKEANNLLASQSINLPWYLKQQILLYLAVNSPESAHVVRRGRNKETKHYRDLIRFLLGETKGLNDREYATLAVLARRSFLDEFQALALIGKSITSHRVQLIAERDPSFGVEILKTNGLIARSIPARLRDDLCMGPLPAKEGWISLAEFVLAKKEYLRNELELLQFVAKCLEKWPEDESIEVIAPCDIFMSQKGLDSDLDDDFEVRIHPSSIPSIGSLYRPPEWASRADKWRFQIGYILRFILSAQQDFTRPVFTRIKTKSYPEYKVPESHWYQRRYGLYNGQPAFGAEWLPITDWIENLLYALLSWPGCRDMVSFKWVESGIQEVLTKIHERVKKLKAMKGLSSGVLMLPLSSSWPEKPKSTRPLRICVVQTVIPTINDIQQTDLTLSALQIRRRHRNHLSAALAAVKRMLDLRISHLGTDSRLDMLILPELAVHPLDIETHLVPFARAFKTIILTGLTYTEKQPGLPLHINSALWLIPIWSKEGGLNVLRRRQGKFHLSPSEQIYNIPDRVLTGFRPCQWLIGYEWEANEEDANKKKEDPLWLTASICYDATDIKLAADLRDQSDVFIVPAMNSDINTFDQMALALHYHMFQMVIIANNGSYGGSNAYAPYRLPYIRQIFHLHGQPQASIAFLEIPDIAEFLHRGRNPQPSLPDSVNGAGWKFPPAGYGEDRED